GYRTFSIYPALGAFMSARNFQTTTGVQEFLDQGALGTNRIEPDRFYYDVALRDFPGERFLLVRYGDHQPDFASLMLEPWLDELGISRRLMTYDPRYFTTYYAIDAVNFKPVNLSSALDTIEGPYLPLVVQEAAGLPLDPSFAEQKPIL